MKKIERPDWYKFNNTKFEKNTGMDMLDPDKFDVWFDEHLKGKVVVDEKDLEKVYGYGDLTGAWTQDNWSDDTHEALIIKSSIREIKKDCEHLPGKFIWNFTEGTEISHGCVKCGKKIAPAGWKEVE